MNFKALIIELVETVLVSLILILVLYSTVASVEVVWGTSMEPNFYTGERILVEKLSKYVKDYQRGDVVVLTPPTDQRKHYLKRIIALPGEIVKVLDCKVFVSKDGEKFYLDENYLDVKECTKGGEAILDGRSMKVEPDTYFVLGDNRDVSVDSRVFGFVKESRIIGKVIFRFWPIGRVGFIS